MDLTIKAYSVSTEPSDNIIIGATGIEAVLQNVRTIISTVKGSVFLNRGVGIDGKLVYKPISTVIIDLITEIYRQVEQYEPRAEVLTVDFDTNDTIDGILNTRVIVRIKEGVLL